MLTSSTQLQNWSCHVVEKTGTSSKCRKMKYARAKRAKILFSIVKYANLWGFCCRRRRGCLSSRISSQHHRPHNLIPDSLVNLKLNLFQNKTNKKIKSIQSILSKCSTLEGLLFGTLELKHLRNHSRSTHAVIS